MILTFRDLDCRDNVPSGFRASGFYMDPVMKVEDITKYLNDYTKRPTNQLKKRSRNNKDTEIIQISDVEDNEIDSKEELNEATKRIQKNV